MKQIPESHMRLLDEPVHPILATVLPDGKPQAHPVWCDYEDGYVRVNTAKGRQKDENLVRERMATLLLLDPEDPYFWMEIRGAVVERVEGQEADAHIDSLAHKYLGVDAYHGRHDGEVRIMYKIEPERILVSGNGQWPVAAQARRPR